jgi:hypothetical protein
MIFVVLISPETPSKNGPKEKISVKYIVHFIDFGIKYWFCSHISPFEATAL